MRLIDADALLHDIKRYADRYIGHEGYYNAKRVEMSFKMAPTVTPEVVQGHWEIEYIESKIIESMPVPIFVCSACNKYSVGNYRYCPDCGARMTDEQAFERR